MKKIFPGFWVVFCFLPISLFGTDLRTLPVDVYVILDASPAMGDRRGEAVKWLCDDLIDGRLLEGDTLTILMAGDKTELLFSGSLNSGEKEAAKQALSRIPADSGPADYPGALREAASRQAGKADRMSYTLLVSGTTGPSAASGGLVRYSRVDEFSGWRVLTVGLGIDQRVKAAAAAFMQ
ncbi:MAG: hypothetical protein LBO80_03530 [Treponema sp.]|jgi:hypothetical protein|nr:hypothetical protein [Treponema sp.]